MMPRPTRIRIAIGLWALVGGIVFGVGAPIVAALTFEPLSPASMVGDDDISAMTQQFQAMQRLSRIISILALAGWAVAFCGFMLAFTTWISWFVRQEGSATPE